MKFKKVISKVMAKASLQMAYLNVVMADFYRSNNEASVYLYSNVGVSTFASTTISTISVPIALGTQVIVSATFVDYDYRTYYANGTFSS